MFDGVRARTLLLELGYAVSFRELGWAECLVEKDEERWIGRGTSPERALEHALSQMFPSAASRNLLDARLDAAEAEAAAAPPPPSSDVELPLLDEAEANELEPPPPDDLAFGLSEARDPSALERGTREVAREDNALAALEQLLVFIDESEAQLAILAPERQRLWLLHWMAWARGRSEEHAQAPAVERAVAAIAKRIGELARAYWPGSVHALRLSAVPADAQIGRRRGDTPPATWGEVAELANRTIEEQIERGGRAGMDEDGWADAADLAPRAPDSARMLEIVEASIAAASDADDADAEDAAPWIEVAARLRWLRGSAVDPQRWGRAMGRLRAATVGSNDAALRELLDARWRPGVPWSRVVERAERSSSPTTAPAKPSEPTELAPPPPGAPPNELLAWLVGAFDASDTPALAEQLRPRREEFLALDEAAMPTPDRRVRRRFRDLRRRLSSRKTDAPPSSHAPLSEPARDVVASPTTLDVLCEELRVHTAGKRALFVSNREDPALSKKLELLLGLSLTWCDGSPRRVQAQCERITQGSYDLVLSATGFQNHSADGTLSQAAGGADVPFIRVDRGRPLACARAIAREFGVGHGHRWDDALERKRAFGRF